MLFVALCTLWYAPNQLSAKYSFTVSLFVIFTFFLVFFSTFIFNFNLFLFLFNCCFCSFVHRAHNVAALSCRAYACATGSGSSARCFTCLACVCVCVCVLLVLHVLRVQCGGESGKNVRSRAIQKRKFEKTIYEKKSNNSIK